MRRMKQRRMSTLKAFFSKFPIGMRSIKTAIAVCLSAAVVKYILHGIPFFACIGAAAAMERTMSDSYKAAIIRNLGTLIGGAVGILLAVIFTGAVSDNSVFLGIGVIPVIALIKKTGRQESVIPGCIVYFATVFLNNSAQSALDYGVTRIIETLIGSLIGIAVNFLIFPPKINTAVK